MLELFLVKHNKSGPGRPTRRAVYEGLSLALAEVRSGWGGLPSPEEAESIWASMWRLEAHQSTALEGNTLVLNQVEALLVNGIAVGNKELREYLEVKGYADAAKWVYAQALDTTTFVSGELVTLSEIRRVHELTLGPVWEMAPHPHALSGEHPGSFRRHEIARFPGGMTSPSWVEVPSAITDWVRSMSRVASAINPVEALAAAHANFEHVHPFLDGNGRTGRLVLNLALIRLGYPPAIIFKRDRAKYLRALQRADQGDPGPLGELIARALTDNLYRFVVPALGGPQVLVPLTALATKERSVVSLRAAIGRGRLRAQKGDDGQWRSCRAWLDEYVASKHRRPSDPGE